MTMVGGSSEMKMTRPGDRYSANTSVNLKAAGLHVWLADLQHPFQAGKPFANASI